MKRLYTILSLIIFSLSVYSQNHVFVLVDGSKSVRQADLISAKQTLTDIFLGITPSNLDLSKINIPDLQRFKIYSGDVLSIMKIGDEQTSFNINPQFNTIKNIPSDIHNIVNIFPTIPTDQNTYLRLAKARLAESAKRAGLNNYKLYIISDEDEDRLGSGGSSNYGIPGALEIAENYNTVGNPAKEEEALILRIKDGKKGFKLKLIPKVDISGWKILGDSDGDGITDDNDNCPNTPVGMKVTSDGCPDKSDEKPVITITSPPQAKKGKEYEINSEKLNVNWTCNNCPQGIKYIVTVSQIDGGKMKETKKNLSANTASFNMPNGKFRVSVSSSNYPSSSSNTYVKVNTKNFEWIIYLLILLAGAALGYYFWNKKRQEKIDESAPNKTDDIFSNGNNKGSSSNTTSNSDYF